MSLPSLPTCGHKNCPGHVRTDKFNTCEDRAIWMLSLEDHEMTGAFLFEGLTTLVIVTEEVTEKLADFGPNNTVEVRVPVGNYVVKTPQGVNDGRSKITIERHKTPEDARESFNVATIRYRSWLYSDSPI